MNKRYQPPQRRLHQWSGLLAAAVASLAILSSIALLFDGQGHGQATLLASTTRAATAPRCDPVADRSTAAGLRSCHRLDGDDLQLLDLSGL
jgi:uncharacterized iron-regulated membrane protein